jgi:RNA polymerase sigma-70 factor, ECF subfamily
MLQLRDALPLTGPIHFRHFNSRISRKGLIARFIQMRTKSFRLLYGHQSAAGGVVPNERELILDAQQGDTAAFKQLYEHYKGRIFTLLYYSLNDISTAEDALQAIFVKVFEALPGFGLESSFLTWLYRIALNECKNRKRRRKLFVPISKETEEFNLVDPAPSPDHQHALKHASLLIRGAVLELKPKYRTVVVLKYLEELSYEEIAAVLGCSQGTIATRLNRALAILEKRLRRFRSVF